MAQEELKKALALMKSGRKKDATLVLQTILRQDRNNAQAWWLMANALEDDDKKRKAAEKVLAIDANHKGAQRLIASLLMTTGSVSSATPPPLTTQEINIDFGKLDELEAKVKPVDESSDDKVIKMATYLIAGFVVVVILAVIFLSVIPNYQTSQKEQAIIASMDGFLSEMVAGDFVAAEGYVCEQYHMDQERTSNFARGLNPLYPDAQVDFVELEITADVLESDTATAILSGQISVTPTDAETEIILIGDLMGESGFDYRRSSFQFILENEQWRICDTSFASE